MTINGSNAAPAIATLTVITPVSTPVAPTVSKAFSPAAIGAPGSSSLVITLSNASTTTADTVSELTDNLPSGLLAVSDSASNNCGGAASNTSSSVTLTGGTIPANGSCEVTVEVTAAVAGSYVNSLAIGALTTDNGNNAAPAIATLTATAPVILSAVAKAFSPATIVAGGSSILTITLSNPNGTAAKITIPLTDTLPIGLVVSGKASDTCNGKVSAKVGGTSVTLAGGSIPAGGSCVVTVKVTAAAAGSYFNSLPAGALITSNGVSAGVSIATLTVTLKPTPSPTPTCTPKPTPTYTPKPTPTPRVY